MFETLYTQSMTRPAKRPLSRAITAENPYGEPGKGGMAASDLGVSRKGRPCIPIASGETAVLMDMKGQGVIRHIWITVTDKTPNDLYALRNLILRMYWEDEDTPSVEAPLGDFFLNGFGAKCDVNSLPMVVNPHGAMNCYLPMPFFSRARITIENQQDDPIEHFFFQIDYTLEALPEDAYHFHAQFRRERITQLTRDYTILDQVKGPGVYVGTFLALTALERFWWGEGEVKFYLDGDEQFPTICGTGMEDYFGGSWAFSRMRDGIFQEICFSTPFMGFPQFIRESETEGGRFDTAMPPNRGMYRWHLPDPVYFDKDIRVTLQQIGLSDKGLFERQDDIATVAYWYQQEPHAPFPALPDKAARRPR